MASVPPFLGSARFDSADPFDNEGSSDAPGRLARSAAADSSRLKPESKARALSTLALLLSIGCAHRATPDVDARISVAPGVTAQSLGRVAIPTFWVEGRVRDLSSDAAYPEIVQRQHADTMELTRTFMNRLVGTDLVVLDRQFVDQRLEELEMGTSPRVSDESAPAFGQELGAQTLIVGRYRFECSGEVLSGRADGFVRPNVVYKQSVQVRGFELETGRVIFDVELGIDAAGAKGRLVPKSLARAAANRLWTHLSQPRRPSE